MSKDTYRTRTEGILYCIVPYYTIPYLIVVNSKMIIICIFPAYLQYRGPATAPFWLLRANIILCYLPQ